MPTAKERQWLPGSRDTSYVDRMIVDDDGVGPSYLASWRWADDGHSGAASSSRSSRQASRLELACPALLVGKRSLMGLQLYGLHEEHWVRGYVSLVWKIWIFPLGLASHGAGNELPGVAIAWWALLDEGCARLVRETITDCFVSNFDHSAVQCSRTSS